MPNCIQILNAIKINNYEQLEFSLQSDCDVNKKIVKGRTALHIAIGLMCDVKMIELLLKHGANVNAKDENDGTPLHIAVSRENNTKAVSLLLKYGANVNASCVNYSSPLHVAACLKNNIETLKLLLSYGADINARDENYITPLHLASDIEDNFQNIKFLLENGSEVNAKRSDNSTPLHYAARTPNNVECIQLLVDYGANVNARSKEGLTPLKVAAWVKSNAKTLRFLYNRGAEVDAKDEHDVTPLLYAANVDGNDENVKTLLECGANINARDHMKRSPLYIAVWMGQAKSAEILLQYGADVDCGTPETYEMLIEKIDIFPEMLDAVLVFARHLIKLKMLNLMEKENYLIWHKLLISRNEELTNFENECRKELDRMCNELICSDRRITYADLLIKELRRVVVYLNVQDVTTRLERVNLVEKFPIFSKIIITKIEEGLKLARLFAEGYDMLELMLGDNRLPPFFLTKILSYLNNADIRNLIQSY